MRAKVLVNLVHTAYIVNKNVSAIIIIQSFSDEIIIIIANFLALTANIMLIKT